MHWISKALNYTPEVIFAVFAFCRPSITAPAPAPLNKLDLSDSRSRVGEEEDKRLSFFEELVLGAEAAQESQQSGLRLGEDKSANIDSSSSIYSRSDGSTSEQGGRHCSHNTPQTSVAGSEAGYEP